MSKYVASTLAAANEYTGYAPKGSNELPRVERSVTIAGGAGVANKHIITPHGVVTEVSDEDAEFLKGHYLFQQHQKGGYVQFLDKKPEDADAVAGDMNGNDPGAPLNESSFENTDTKAPTTGAGNHKRK